MNQYEQTNQIKMVLSSICFIVSSKKSLLLVKKQIINYNNKILLSSYGEKAITIGLNMILYSAVIPLKFIF